MSIKVKISKDGELEISLTEFSIKKYETYIDEIDDKNIKKNNLIKEVHLDGIINQEIMTMPTTFQVDTAGKVVVDENGNAKEEISEIDSIRKLASFAVIPEYVDCYKDLSVEIINTEGVVVKKENFKNMYIYHFEERSDNEMGIGTYKVKFREKILNADN